MSASPLRGKIKNLSHGISSVGQVEKTFYLRYHPHWRKRARFARTIMRSAGVTAADAVGYYLPEWLSPRPRKSIRYTFPCRHPTAGGSLEGSLAGTPLTHRFFDVESTLPSGGRLCQAFFSQFSKNFSGGGAEGHRARMDSLRRPWPARPCCTRERRASRSRFRVPRRVR